MIVNKAKQKNIGWKFDNTFTKLPNLLFSKVEPAKVLDPKLIIFNNELAKTLDLNFDKLEKDEIALLLSGEVLPKGSFSIAQAYAGHQFGHFTILGDGRAILLGEHLNQKNIRFDIQLKGAGRTPYSRSGDGKASLGSMLREYIISEAMHGLKIPTSRSLAVVKTGENVFREEILDGSVLTRVASSHIRIGTFQYLSYHQDNKSLKKLMNYTIDRHYPNIKNNNDKAVSLIKELMNRQISLIVDWMRVGFIHGVMNTDNMTLSGETIDYGPCAFMDYYNPKQVFSSIDIQKRYSFINQRIICHWNISRLAESLIPLISENREEAIIIGKSIINEFDKKFNLQWISIMKKKLGFIGDNPNDFKFIVQFLEWMDLNNADYTNTFNDLMYKNFNEKEIYKDETFKILLKEWSNRVKNNKCSNELSFTLMKENNPSVIPRNHKVEEAIKSITENNDYNNLNRLLKIIKNPYDIKNKESEDLKEPPSIQFTKEYKTFCGT